MAVVNNNRIKLRWFGQECMELPSGHSWSASFFFLFGTEKSIVKFVDCECYQSKWRFFLISLKDAPDPMCIQWSLKILRGTLIRNQIKWWRIERFTVLQLDGFRSDIQLERFILNFWLRLKESRWVNLSKRNNGEKCSPHRHSFLRLLWNWEHLAALCLLFSCKCRTNIASAKLKLHRVKPHFYYSFRQKC